MKKNPRSQFSADYTTSVALTPSLNVDRPHLFSLETPNLSVAIAKEPSESFNNRADQFSTTHQITTKSTLHPYDFKSGSTVQATRLDSRTKSKTGNGSGSGNEVVISRTKLWLLLIFVLVAIVASTLAVVFATSKKPEETSEGNRPFQLVREGNDYVGLVFVQDDVSEETKKFFRDAAHRWSGFITNSIPGTTFPGKTLNSNCPQVSKFIDLEAWADEFVPNSVLNHLVVFVDLIDTGGVGTVSQTGSCFVDRTRSFAIVSLMQIDISFLNVAIADGDGNVFVPHEMGHALGFGIFWTAFGLLQHAVYNNSNVGDLTQEPIYVGQNAIDQQTILTGGAMANVAVPVENGRFGFTEAQITSGAAKGVTDVHWNETQYGNEVMTFFHDVGEGEVCFSQVTLGSLQDMGFTVDLSKAEVCSLPISPVGQSAVVKNIRGKKTWIDIIRERGEGLEMQSPNELPAGDSP